MNRELIADSFRSLQDFICSELERINGEAKFSEDIWQREEGGGGRTRTLKGKIIEKGGVAFSEVFGTVSDLMKTQMGLQGDSFFATGVSIVLHPTSPHVPIIHMNVRYFELNNGDYWFGGGIDLTPHYVSAENAKKFHQKLKDICGRHGMDYQKFKIWADDYFFIPHRNETRGVGGVFFDHLKIEEPLGKKKLLDFCLDLGKSFPFIYEEQVLAGKDKPIEDHHKKWMNLRRGRYVEFNLVHDRGTKFGLVSGGRTESILMSLPANASWEYNFHPEPDSEETKTLNCLQKNIDWLA